MLASSQLLGKYVYLLAVLASPQAQENLVNLVHPNDKQRYVHSLRLILVCIHKYRQTDGKRFYPFSCEPKRPTHAHASTYTLVWEEQLHSFKSTNAHLALDYFQIKNKILNKCLNILILCMLVMGYILHNYWMIFFTEVSLTYMPTGPCGPSVPGFPAKPWENTKTFKSKNCGYCLMASGFEAILLLWTHSVSWEPWWFWRSWFPYYPLWNTQ